jgi:D-lyxose ketol-isomerase
MIYNASFNVFQIRKSLLFDQKGHFMNKSSRRTILKATTATALAMAMTSAGCATPSKKSSGSISFNNADFYDKNGTFNENAGKEAYIELMKYHGYPVFDNIKETLWVSDYGTGQFTKLGLGANMFANDEKQRYMVMDLFLLPNQMLPEHYHLETGKGPAKMEGWLVRHGISYVYGEGTPTKNIKADIPKCHLNGTATVYNETILLPGQTTHLNRATARHWQFGGPKGAILTETATFHDGDGVRHSETKLVFP